MQTKNYINFRSKEQQLEIHSRCNPSSKIQITVQEKVLNPNPLRQKLLIVENYIQNNKLQIFWLSLYVMVTAAIFAERVYGKHFCLKFGTFASTSNPLLQETIKLN